MRRRFKKNGRHGAGTYVSGFAVAVNHAVPRILVEAAAALSHRSLPFRPLQVFSLVLLLLPLVVLLSALLGLDIAGGAELL